MDLIRIQPITKIKAIRYYLDNKKKCVIQWNNKNRKESPKNHNSNMQMIKS